MSQYIVWDSNWTVSSVNNLYLVNNDFINTQTIGLDTKIAAIISLEFTYGFTKTDNAYCAIKRFINNTNTEDIYLSFGFEATGLASTLYRRAVAISAVEYESFTVEVRNTSGGDLLGVTVRYLTGILAES